MIEITCAPVLNLWNARFVYKQTELESWWIRLFMNWRMSQDVKLSWLSLCFCNFALLKILCQFKPYRTTDQGVKNISPGCANFPLPINKNFLKAQSSVLSTRVLKTWEPKKNSEPKTKQNNKKWRQHLPTQTALPGQSEHCLESKKSRCLFPNSNLGNDVE